MRKTLLFSLFSLLLMTFLVGCSDDEKIDYGPYVDPNDQVLTVTQNSVTSSTFTFSVEAEDANIPYVAMHVDKATIDGVDKYDLPKYLMGELESKAVAEGVTLEEYLSKVSHKGNLSNQQIAALAPGNVYELVVFAFSGTTPATKFESVFFETPAIDKIDCNFSLTPAATPYVVTVDVVSEATDEDLYYFPVLSYKSGYDFTAELISKDIILNNSFSSYFNEALQMKGGNFDEALALLVEVGLISKNEEELLPFAGVDAGTDYKYLIGAYKVVETSAGKEIVLASEVGECNVSTPKVVLKDLEGFTIKKEIENTSMKIIVTPPAGYEGVFSYGVISANGASYEGDDLMMVYLNTLAQEGKQPKMCEKEDVAVIENVRPGAEYKVVVFEYFYGPLSHAYQRDFFVPSPDYTKKATLNVTAQSTYDFNFEISGGGETVPYYVWMGFDQMAGKDVIEAELNYYYSMYSKEFGMKITDFLYGKAQIGYTPDMMNIYIGNQKFNSGKIAPGIYGAAFFPLKADEKNGGIFVETPMVVQTMLEYSDKTAPTFVPEYFSAEVAGKVFGKEYPKDQIMVVMDYSKAVSALAETPEAKICYGIVKDNAGITVGMDDVDLMYYYGVDYKELPSHNLVFTMCGQGNYYGLTYLQEGSQYSQVNREVLIESDARLGTEAELQALYDKAFTPAPVQPVEPEVKQRTSFFQIGEAKKETTTSIMPVEESSKNRTVSDVKSCMVGVAY